MPWKYDYLVDQIHRTAYKKHESYIISSLIHDESLSELKPCTQFYVKYNDINYALIDLYYPQIELAIEIDEPPHKKNTKRDKLRQDIISERLSCKFIRITVNNERNDIPEQIAQLKQCIKSRILEFQNKKAFTEWLEPHRLDFSVARTEFKNSLFLKIKGEIHPDQLMARQTGYWHIAQSKRSKIEQVVVVHDSIISRVFTVKNWHTCEQDQRKVGYSGDEINPDNIVGTIIENWNWQQTVAYSNDIG